MITPYSTLSEATTQLREKGYKSEFKMAGKQLQCIETEKKFNADELVVVEQHRFEGASNPDDMSIVFAAKCNDGTKGVIVSSFGTYADQNLLKFMDDVKVADPTEAAEPIKE